MPVSDRAMSLLCGLSVLWFCVGPGACNRTQSIRDLPPFNRSIGEFTGTVAAAGLLPCTMKWNGDPSVILPSSLLVPYDVPPPAMEKEQSSGYIRSTTEAPRCSS